MRGLPFKLKVQSGSFAAAVQSAFGTGISIAEALRLTETKHREKAGEPTVPGS